MNAFQANIEVLSRRRPDLAKLLSGAEVTVRGLALEKSECGKPYLRLRGPGVNTPLENEKDPAADARRSMAGVSASTRLLVLKGLGLGYILKAANAAHGIERIIAVEPRLPLFALMMGVTDLRRVFEDSRIEFFVGDGAAAAVGRIKEAYNHGTERGRLLIMLPPYTVMRHPIMAVTPEFDREFDAQMKSIGTISERNHATLGRFVDPWRRHLLENLPAMIRAGTTAALRDCGRKAPGILVAAGPSLEKNLGQLKKASEHAVIAVVDTALRAVLSADVVPDFVVSVDATEENAEYFEIASAIPERSALVMVPVIRPAIPRLFRRVYCTSYGHPFQKWFEGVAGREFGSLLVSGSVSTIAFDLLRWLGCSPIVMAGADLAYAEGTHVRGAKKRESSRFATAELATWSLSRSAGIEKPGWGGLTARTTREMLRWAEWFETEIARSRWNVINATEGGLRLSGTHEMRLEEAVRDFRGRKPVLPFPAPLPGDARKRLIETGRAIVEGSGAGWENHLDNILKWERALFEKDRLAATKLEFRSRLGEILSSLATEKGV